jgi:hypothetical protein
MASSYVSMVCSYRVALLRLPRGTSLGQAATGALIAESIRRCQCGRCKHNPLPLAHNAYTSVTCAACAGVQRQEGLQRLANGESLVDVARTYDVDPTTIGRLQGPFVSGSAAAA